MTLSNLNNRNHLLLLAGCLCIPLTVVFLLGAGGRWAADARLEQNRRAIEQMTPAQRARLDRNYETFQQMTQQQRQKYRDMHGRLQQAPGGAALRETMVRYTNWLETLSPFRRKELRETTDIPGRIELVQRFKAEQSSPAPLTEEEPRLSREDLAAMMNVLARELQLPQEELQDMPELERHLHILVSSLRRARRNQTRFRGWSSMFDQKMIDKMIAALPDGEFRTAIGEIRRFKDQQRRIVVGNIFELLRKDVSEKVNSRQPTPDDLKRTLERLGSDERRRYARLESLDEQNQFLTYRFRWGQTYEFRKAFPELRMMFFPWPPSRDRDGNRRGSQPREGRETQNRQRSPSGRQFPPGGPRPQGAFRPGEARRGAPPE